MTTSFKTLLNTDIQSTRTKLHEAIPVTGTILSGTYTMPAAAPAATSEENIKDYTHGLFQSVYDYPYLSSSANHILDLTVGYSTGSDLSSSVSIQNAQKIQMYNQMAQVLVGYDTSGNIRPFDEDGDLGSGTKLESAYFLNFARLLSKDEIQKGTFYMDLSVWPSGATAGGAAPGAVTTNVVRVYDASGSTSWKVNSPVGEYNVLYATASTSHTLENQIVPVGLIYYQAGIVVLSSSVFQIATSGGILSDEIGTGTPISKVILAPNATAGGGYGATGSFMSSSISGACNSFRARVQNLYFANTTELNSTIYFCRANANEFNYSSNPTYLSESQIRVKEARSDEPITYMTSVGLYGANNELLAVAKLSEPLKKTPANEFTLRVRLDY